MGLGFGVWGLGFRVLGSRVWVIGFKQLHKIFLVRSNISLKQEPSPAR